MSCRPLCLPLCAFTLLPHLMVFLRLARFFQLPTVPRIRLSCILCTWFPLRRWEERGTLFDGLLSILPQTKACKFETGVTSWFVHYIVQILSILSGCQMSEARGRRSDVSCQKSVNCAICLKPNPSGLRNKKTGIKHNTNNRYYMIFSI